VSFNESSVETTALEWFGETEEDKTGLVQTAVIGERRKRPVLESLKPTAGRAIQPINRLNAARTVSARGRLTVLCKCTTLTA
jgi:hypothetical protein